MDTAKITAMIIAVLIGAYIFMRFLTITRIPFIASEFIVDLGISRYLVIAVILVSFIILGTFFDMIAVLTVSVPILFPIIISLGFDPLWFGVLMVRMLEMGFVTPPFGINLFAVAGASGVPMITVYRGVIPFVMADVMHVALLVAVPQLSTWLPKIMMSLR
jgi:TRAP-type C4-dicarboxylate transport system permease large subunit